MQYKCSICGYIYDDAKESIPFNELPDSWCCPLCGAPKSAFEPLDETKTPIHKTPKDVKNKTPLDEDLTKLSSGQLAALFSNLARGAEKQYKNEESSLYKEIADYFTAITPVAQNASLDALLDFLKLDISENYPLAKDTAEQYKDRGAQRVCVWGDKVTRMLVTLVERYQKEGEAFLQGVEVWVCTVCGFVYIGEEAPALCPVCKVPSWKFEKIEGGNR